MAGLSSSLNVGKETSSHPPLLTIKKLMPRRLPPIGIEGPKTTVDQPPPPPSSPIPWSWYHRNCTPSPRSRSDSLKPRPLTPTSPFHRRNNCKSVKPLSNIGRYMNQQNDLKKCSRSASLKDSTDDLWSLDSFLNGRTHLMVDYARHFLPPSELEALVQTLQHHSIHSGDSAQSTVRIESQLQEEDYYNTAAITSELSTWTESEISIRLPCGSDDPAHNTGSSEFESDSDHSSRQPKFNDRTSFHSRTPSTHQPSPSVTFLKCSKYRTRLVAAQRKRRVLLFALLFIYKTLKQKTKSALIRSRAKKISSNNWAERVMNSYIPIKETVSPRIKNSASLNSSDTSSSATHKMNNPLSPIRNSTSPRNYLIHNTEIGTNATNDKVVISLPPQKERMRSPKAQNDALQSGTDSLNSRKIPPKPTERRPTLKKIATQPSPIIDPIIPLPRRLPVPDRRDSMLTPPIFHPRNVSLGTQTPALRRLPIPGIKEGHNATNPVAERSVPIHRKLPTPNCRPHRLEQAKLYNLSECDLFDQVNPLGPDSTVQRFAGRRILQQQHAFEYNTQPSHLAPITSDDAIVIEMWIRNARTHEELLLLRKLPKLVSDVTKYKSMYQSLLQQSKMSEFLLHVAQAIFEEMVSLDQLIKKILEVAQRLVSADRASLFLVDHRNFELVSTVFDLQYESNNDSDFSKKEIRMPINKGIAGHVAMSGETMNIPDAYSDERFNKAVDEATGYRTVSILCMPIKVRGKVIAVVQMVNKRDKEAFGNDDEAAFQVFSTFFGLALHHARLYDKIKRKEQKYKVALEVLGYHNTCAEEDVTNLVEERGEGESINYNDFALNPFEVDEVEKCKGILTMFDDLFDLTKFDVPVIARFVLTVKKNYRKVPYHNFDHGWAVANAMYVMLKHDTENRFDYNNRLALFIACLCHDLDHRGYTNKFMSEIASPLATIYTTSTLEHHHFNMTVTILQQDGHNIFNHMSSEGYKDMLDSIRQCILATDLATLFPNLKKINELVFDTSQFDWDDVNHRALSKSFAMTCADLCAAAKPFEVQLVTAEIITAEFYQQGDLERQAGRTPVPMMDRSRPEELPACQVGFLSQICLPCYTVLSKLFPTTEPMLSMTKQNLDIWKTRASDIERKNKNN